MVGRILMLDGSNMGPGPQFAHANPKAKVTTEGKKKTDSGT